MESIIKGKTYNTETATHLGSKCVGEFGQADGYEEQLFVNEAEQHFIYGVGGTESPYPEPQIKSFQTRMVKKWLADNN
ncbi:MAG: hypothetical protein FWD19_06030 [Defluviitaleaceae bacterium]|nr:hypothetical protein [Defluviitaleaceae bacterium]